MSPQLHFVFFHPRQWSQQAKSPQHWSQQAKDTTPRNMKHGVQFMMIFPCFDGKNNNSRHGSFGYQYQHDKVSLGIRSNQIPVQSFATTQDAKKIEATEHVISQAQVDIDEPHILSKDDTELHQESDSSMISAQDNHDRPSNGMRVENLSDFFEASGNSPPVPTSSLMMMKKTSRLCHLRPIFFAGTID